MLTRDDNLGQFFISLPNAILLVLIFRIILKYATTHNHPKPSTTTHNYPQPPITIHNHPQPPPKSSTTTHNYPQPPKKPSTTAHNHPQPPKKPPPTTTHNYSQPPKNYPKKPKLVTNSYVTTI